jgi:thioredoxin-related protein
MKKHLFRTEGDIKYETGKKGKAVLNFIEDSTLNIAMITLLSLGLCYLTPVYAENTQTNSDQFPTFDDSPKPHKLKHPSWFKKSFLDFQIDIREAREAGKLGIIIYFGQEHCAYCKMLLDVNFAQQTDIVNYTQKYFDVIAVDAWGDLDLTTPDGQNMTEKAFADREKTNFSPSLLFYNVWGKEIFRMRGYYPPYRFRASLDFIVGQFYHKESFREYLERAEPSLSFEGEALTPHELFMSPPYLLGAQKQKRSKPLLVLFEQAKCHACDVLHSDTLQNDVLLKQLDNFDVVQLNMWADTPVETPAGQRTTAKKWATELNLFYSPTLMFFDETGAEIIRIDSTVQLYRLQQVTQYVSSGAYKNYPRFQRWHMEEVLRKK